jgi:pyruvate dehydrogenase E2 component (dihydrolipoamide acetyltransferase)
MTTSITAITMPKWGLTMTEGKVVRWLKPEGEPFAQGDELLEIETSKITNVVEADADGTLGRIVAQEGSTLPIGALLAVLAPGDTAAAEIDEFVAGFVAVEPPDDTTEVAETVAPRELDVGGRRMRYLELGAGDGVPVLLVHGFGADLNSWMFTQPALSEGRRTIALELPGHGGSTKEVGTGDAGTFVAIVEDALEELGVRRAHLVGHSMGGALAAMVAVHRPELTASLTLIASAGLGPEINGAFIEGFVRVSRRREAAELLTLLVHDPALVSRAMVEDVLRYKRIDGVTTALEAIARTWFAGGRQACDVLAAITAMAAPVQIIWGRNDRIIPVAHAEALVSRLPVHILDAAGHLPHMEKAGDVNRLIRQFVAA